MSKYRRLRRSLVQTDTLRPDQLSPTDPAPIDAVLAVHDPDYVDAVLRGTLDARAVRKLGFPWSRALVARTLSSVHGTLLAAQSALDHGIAGNLAGGTHHAYADHGSGFCVFNDIAIAARRLLDDGRVTRVLVFDADVHQGDGTAAIFADEPRVFTCSLHGDNNFPFQKQVSDLDVPLPDDTGDRDYLGAITEALATCFRKFAPDVVFYQAGVDALAQDKLGRLSVTHAGLRERDRRVIGAARERGLPIVLTLGGGYAQPLQASIAAHAGTYVVAAEFAR